MENPASNACEHLCGKCGHFEDTQLFSQKCEMIGTFLNNMSNTVYLDSKLEI